jgi:hypothetical protein
MGEEGSLNMTIPELPVGIHDCSLWTFQVIECRWPPYPHVLCLSIHGIRTELTLVIWHEGKMCW